MRFELLFCAFSKRYKPKFKNFKQNSMNKKIILGSLVAVIAIVASFFIVNQSSQSNCCKVKSTASTEKCCDTQCECGDTCIGEGCDCSDACQANAVAKDECCDSESTAMTSSVESNESCANDSCNEKCTCGESCTGANCDCPCGSCK
jgi:hypothetical protein